MNQAMPEDALEWLAEVSADPARDEALRRSARALRSGETGNVPPAPSAAPSVTDGRLLFRSLGCAGCHNLDGEGFAAGPDLLAVLSGFGDSEARAWLSHPPVASLLRFETSTGRNLKGWIEEEHPDRLLLLDPAGNRFEQDPGTITRRNPAAAEASPCRATADLDAAAFAGLLAFLRSQSTP
jgi:hypothetical protein